MMEALQDIMIKLNAVSTISRSILLINLKSQINYEASVSELDSGVSLLLQSTIL